MKILNYLFICISLIMLILFLNSEVKREKVSEENENLKYYIEQLKKDLEKYENDPGKLLQEIKDAFDEENNDKLENSWNNIIKFHPQSIERVEAEKIYKLNKQRIEERLSQEKQLKEKEEKERLASLNRLKKKFDDVSGVTWYQNPYFIHYNNINSTSIYIGKDDDSVWLRLKMSYEGDNWIFFEKAYLSYDGNTIDIPFNYYNDRKSENDGGSVWEWIDVSVDSATLSFLRKMVNSKSAKMRLSGKYTETKTLTPKEINAIKDVISGYDILLSGSSN